MWTGKCHRVSAVTDWLWEWFWNPCWQSSNFDSLPLWRGEAVYQTFRQQPLTFGRRWPWCSLVKIHLHTLQLLCWHCHTPATQWHRLCYDPSKVTQRWPNNFLQLNQGMTKEVVISTSNTCNTGLNPTSVHSKWAGTNILDLAIGYEVTFDQHIIHNPKTIPTKTPCLLSTQSTVCLLPSSRCCYNSGHPAVKCPPTLLLYRVNHLQQKQT